MRQISLATICCVLFAGTMALPVMAEDKPVQGSASAHVPLGPVKKLTDAEKRALELDKLFAQLHQDKAPDAINTEKKIWTLWAHNDSPTAELLLTQANVAMADRAFDTSESMLDTLLDSYPDYVEALNKRATLYYNTKRYDEALADLDKVLEAEPRHFGALAARGFVLSAQKNFGPAATAFRDALAINPNMEGVAAALKLLQHDYPDI